MKSLHEGLTATRIAEFLNAQLRTIGIFNRGPAVVIAIDTGAQCSIAGFGKMFDEFMWMKSLSNYTGHDRQPASFKDPNFEVALIRLVNFDETFHKMPYDVRKSMCTVWNYPTMMYLATIFGITVSTVHKIIHRFVKILHCHLVPKYIKWHSMQIWQNLAGMYPEWPRVVAILDCTPFRISKPKGSK